MKRQLMALASAGLLALGLVITPVADVSATAATAECKATGWQASRNGTASVHVPMTAGGSANCQRGPHGEPYLPATAVLQHTMNYYYRKNLLIDGLYGGKTITAMRSVQDTVKVPVDGIYGKNTHNAMEFIDVDDWSGPCLLAKKV